MRGRLCGLYQPEQADQELPQPWGRLRPNSCCQPNETEAAVPLAHEVRKPSTSFQSETTRARQMPSPSHRCQISWGLSTSDTATQQQQVPMPISGYRCAPPSLEMEEKASASWPRGMVIRATLTVQWTPNVEPHVPTSDTWQGINS